MWLFSCCREGKDLSPVICCLSRPHFFLWLGQWLMKRSAGQTVSQHVCAREGRSGGQPQTCTAEYIRANIRGVHNTLNSEQKPTGETSAIPSWFVLCPPNSKEKHHPPPMCFPSCYWPPLAAPPLAPPQKKNSTSQDVWFREPLIGLSQQRSWRDREGTTLLFKTRPVIPEARTCATSPLGEKEGARETEREGRSGTRPVTSLKKTVLEKRAEDWGP